MWVRDDLTIAQQIVQAAHATHESGAAFGCSAECHLILFKVLNQGQLHEVMGICKENNIQYCAFNEPDPESEPLGLTALCTEPIYGDGRKLFKKFKIWRAEN